MIGLPFEDEEDIAGIIDLAERTLALMKEKRADGILTLSINPFVPKPFTPFQWMPMAEEKYLKKSLLFIKDRLKKHRNIKIIAESVREAMTQGILARGGRELSATIAKIVEGENRTPTDFLREIKKTGKTAFYLTRERDKDEVFPWETLDMGFSREYIYGELKRAESLTATLKCFEGCTRCGVCKSVVDGRNL